MSNLARGLVLVALLAGALFMLFGSGLRGREGRLPEATSGGAAAPRAATPAFAAPGGAVSAPASGTAAAAPAGATGDPMPALQKRLEANANDSDTWREMGKLLAQRQNYSGAAEAFAAALEIAPADARAHNDLATALLYLGLVRSARAEYQRAIALDPSLAEARFNLAITLSHATPADVPRALEEWQRVIDLSPGSELAGLARQYMDQYAKSNAASGGSTPSAATTPAPGAGSGGAR